MQLEIFTTLESSCTKGKSSLNISVRGKLGAKRKGCAESYRYGFNGKENDNEVKGNGNQQDYGMRIYDPRLGRFLSVDPVAKAYPFYSPYQFAGNTPIQAIDLDGLEPMVPMQGGAYTSPSSTIQRPITDPAALMYLSSKIGGNHGDVGSISNAAVGIIAPFGEAINTFISGHNEDGSKAGILDYTEATGNIFLFGTLFGGEGNGKVGGFQAPKLKVPKTLRDFPIEPQSPKGADFVVSPEGTALPTSQSRMKEGFEAAEFPQKRAIKTSEAGTIFEVPTKNGAVDVRAMEGSGNHPKRSVVTHPNTNNGKTLDGKATNKKAEYHHEQKD